MSKLASHLFKGLTCIFLIACRNYPKELPIPFDINKRIVISEKCNKIIYASNKFNLYNPVIINNVFNYKKVNFQNTENTSEKDLLPFSISCDCKLLSLVSMKSEGSFQVLYFDISTGTFLNVTQDLHDNNGSPFFSPNDSILAFLSNGVLKLYDYRKKQFLNNENNINNRFEYLTWTNSGKGLYLQDHGGDIWLYDLSIQRYTKLFISPNPFYTNRFISPTKNDSTFYFISDHASNFNQIYKYSNAKIEQVVNSNYDKYLMGRTIENNEIIYRENRNGNFSVKKLKDNNTSTLLSLEKGVVYDYYESMGQNISLSSSLNEPINIHLARKTQDKISLTNNLKPKPIAEPEIFFNKEGMVNYIYTNKKLDKGWIVWLHGGPYEQASIRYNPFINSLVLAGYGVIVLNYPGSTGIGNSYEFRDLPYENQLEIQLKKITRDLKAILNRKTYKKSVSILGNSYGAVLAHNLVQRKDFKFSKLIDFSGIYNVQSIKSNIPTLYMYGENDFALADPNRIALLEKDRDNVEIYTLKQDGHAITKRSNNELILNKMLEFLQK